MSGMSESARGLQFQSCRATEVISGLCQASSLHLSESKGW